MVGQGIFSFLHREGPGLDIKIILDIEVKKPPRTSHAAFQGSHHGDTEGKSWVCVLFKIINEY